MADLIPSPVKREVYPYLKVAGESASGVMDWMKSINLAGAMGNIPTPMLKQGIIPALQGLESASDYIGSKFNKYAPAPIKEAWDYFNKNPDPIPPQAPYGLGQLDNVVKAGMRIPEAMREAAMAANETKSAAAIPAIIAAASKLKIPLQDMKNYEGNLFQKISDYYDKFKNSSFTSNSVTHSLPEDLPHLLLDNSAAHSINPDVITGAVSNALLSSPGLHRVKTIDAVQMPDYPGMAAHEGDTKKVLLNNILNRFNPYLGPAEYASDPSSDRSFFRRLTNSIAHEGQHQYQDLYNPRILDNYVTEPFDAYYKHPSEVDARRVGDEATKRYEDIVNKIFPMMQGNASKMRFGDISQLYSNLSQDATTYGLSGDEVATLLRPFNNAIINTLGSSRTILDPNAMVDLPPGGLLEQTLKTIYGSREDILKNTLQRYKLGGVTLNPSTQDKYFLDLLEESWKQSNPPRPVVSSQPD